MKIKLPKGAKLILDKLEASGFEAYVVGGCVRDALRNAVPGDWDICTSAMPEQVGQALEGIKVIGTGLKFGTVTAVIEKQPYEITTFRTDGQYTDSRRPDDVVFVSNLCEDLARRDFTMNAMAYNETSGLVDLFGGETDISRRLIRAVGDPSLRFEEDALRIMRALRFSAVLGFSVEEKTAEAALLYRNKLKNIAVERVFIELKKLIDGADAPRVIAAYPEIIEAAAAKPILFATLPDGTAIRFALIFDDPVSVLKRLRAPNLLIESVDIIKYTPFPETRGQAMRTFGKIGEKSMSELCKFHRFLGKNTDGVEIAVREAADNGLCCTLSQLAVRGSDLIALGLPENKIISETLELLLYKVTEGEAENNKNELLSLINNQEAF